MEFPENLNPQEKVRPNSLEVMEALSAALSELSKLSPEELKELLDKSDKDYTYDFFMETEDFSSLGDND